MALQERRGGARSRTEWFTAAFWILTALFVYTLVGIPFWWEWPAFTVAGVVLTYAWWHRRQRTRYSIAVGVICAFFAATALAVSGAAALITVSAPVESVGPRKVDCGSVVNPVPETDLTVTTESGDPVVPSRPIPQSSLKRVCSDQLQSLMRGAVGLTLVGLLLGVRATGHLLARHQSAPTGSPTRRA